MSRKTFSPYLDDPRLKLDDPEDQALADILAQVEQLETPDPGQAYWNTFNHRLQQRLAEQPVKRRTRLWLLPSFAAVAAALILGWLVVFQTGAPTPTSLDELSEEGLMTIGELYEYAEEGWLSQDLLGGELDSLLDTIELIYQEDDSEDSLELLPGEDFLETWEMEG